MKHWIMFRRLIFMILTVSIRTFISKLARSAVAFAIPVREMLLRPIIPTSIVIAAVDLRFIPMKALTPSYADKCFDKKYLYAPEAV